MKKPPQNQAAAKFAYETINDIAELEKRPEFQSFMKRLEGRAKKLEEKILRGDMPPEAREHFRQRWLELRDVLRHNSEQVQAQKGVLRQLGMDPDSAPL